VEHEGTSIWAGQDAQYMTRECQSYLEGTPPVLTCNGQLLQQLFEAGTAWLEKNSDAINALNVYPVPDGDTGTNMLLTMESALQELYQSPQHSAAAVSHTLSHGALMGARGNSGVILSQLLRGLSRSLSGKDEFDTQDLASALAEASATAYKAVVNPVEGTILTVARDIAEAASGAAPECNDLNHVLCLVVEAGKISVDKTPSLLPVLAEAGVVDAGGQGLLVLFAGMLRFLKGEPVDVVPTAAVSLPTWTAHPAHPEGEREYGYEVVFLLQGTGLDVDNVRQTISTMGDSVVVVGDGEQIKVHVHTEDPGAPLTNGVSRGTLSNVVVENLQLQTGRLAAPEALSPVDIAKPVAHRGDIEVVAVSPGPGISRVLESLGVSAIVPVGQTMNPSTEQLLRAVEGIAADQVIVLPNNSNILLAAQQVDALTEKSIRVVSSESIPQGIAAVLAFNYQAGLDANARSMEQATQNVQTIETTKAIRSAQINGLSVEAGQAIGICNGKLTVCSDEMIDVVKKALSSIDADDYEIATIYYGENIAGEEAQALLTELEGIYSLLEFELIQGGQPHYHYIISVE
jgi:DAK2 domain fusion protein YloV